MKNALLLAGVSALCILLTNGAHAQIMIGGPDGVVFGRGYGLRIGGYNGMHVGGGQGARFGPPGYGVQLGGGYGAQFGPYPHGVHIGGRGYAPRPIVHFNGNGIYQQQQYADQQIQSIPSRTSYTLPNRGIQTNGYPPSGPTSSGNLQGRKVLYLPPDANQAVQYSLNGTPFRLQPGRQIDLSRNQSWTVVFPTGVNGQRRSVEINEPGLFVFTQTENGLDLIEQEQAVSVPSNTNQSPLPPPPPSDEMEELPEPRSAIEEPVLEDRSSTNRMQKPPIKNSNFAPRPDAEKPPALKNSPRKNPEKELKSVLEKRSN